MAEDEILWSEDAARRIATAVRAVEGMNPVDQKGPRHSVPVPVVFIKVTGAISSGRYPGQVRQRDGTAGSWSDLGSAGDVWVVGANGEALASGTSYGCRCTGVIDADGKPEYTALGVMAAGSDPDATHTVRGYVSLADQYVGAGTKTVDKLAFPATVGTIANGDAVLQYRTIPSVAAAMFLTISDRVDSNSSASLYFFGGTIRFRSSDAPGTDGVIIGGQSGGTGPGLIFYSHFPNGTCQLAYGTVSGDATSRSRFFTDGTVQAVSGFLTGAGAGFKAGVTGTFKSGDPTPKTISVTNGIVTGIV